MNVEKKLEQLEVKCMENADFFTKLKSRVDIALSSNIPALNKTLADLRNDFEKMKYGSGDVMKKVEENANQNEAIVKKLAKFSELWGEFQNIHANSKNFVEKLAKLELSMKMDYEKLNSKILNVENLMKSNIDEIKAYVKTAVLESNKLIEKKNSENFEKFKNANEERLDYIEKISKEKLEREKRLITETVSSTNERLNKINLDLENSILKSGNNEIQLKIIEKKLENIYLIIKKLEMTV